MGFPLGRGRDRLPGPGPGVYAFEGAREDMTYGRRRILVASGSLAAGVALVGCSSSSSEERTVGETVSNGGLEITFQEYAIDSTLTVVSIDESGTLETDDEGEPVTETYEPAEDHEFLVVVVAMENAGDEPAGVPVPGGNLISTGELRFRVTGSERHPIPTATDDGRAIDDGYEFDGEILDRLSLAVGSVQGELPAGESLAGWIPYEVPGSMDPSTAELVYAVDPDIRYAWVLKSD